MLRQLEKMKEIGIDEFFIYPGFGLEYPNYLEESWFEYVGWTIKQAKRLKMHVWIYDELNWPSSSAMGYLPKYYPQYRCKMLARSTTKLGPGHQYNFGISYKPLCAFIRKSPRAGWERVELVNNEYVNTTSQVIDLLVFDVRIHNYPSLSTNSVLNTWNQRGVCDFMNPDAVKAYIQCVHQKYYDHFKAECGKTLRGFFYDEPYVAGQSPCGEYLPWTNGIEEMFRKRYGYDLLDHLPELLENVPGSEKFRSDYWTWVVERGSQSYSKTIADWCAAHHLESTGHCVYEELIDQNERLFCCGEPHAVIKYNQIPGMDMLMDPSPFHWATDVIFIGSHAGRTSDCLFTAKQACSTARYAGAKRVMCEACGILAPNVRIGREKYPLSWMAACGVSMMNENSLPYSFHGFGKRGNNKMFSQPWMKDYGIFADAVRELSRFATGLLRTEVCVLCPESTVRAGTIVTQDRRPLADVNIHPATVGTMENLMRCHIDFEAMFEDILVESPVKKGVLRAPNSAFKVMVIPHAPILRPEVAKKVREFIDGGGKVFFVERRTERYPDGTRCDFTDVPLLDPTDVGDAVRKVVSLPYEITTDGEVFSALRDCDGVPTLLLSNQGLDATDLEVKLHLKGPVAAKVVGEDAEWQYDGSRIHLAHEQVVLLRVGKRVARKTPTLEWGELPAGKMQLCGPWEYSLDKPNNALMGFELGLCPDKVARDDISKVPLWIPVTVDGIHDLDFAPEEYPYYWLKGKFIIEDSSVIPELSLVAEQDDLEAIYVNGKRIGKGVEYPLWTHECRKFDIERAVKMGENELVILCKTTIWADPKYHPMIFILNYIDTFVLHGNFAVKGGEEIPRLKKLPERLAMGDWTKQGFPYYSGDVIYHCFIRGGKPRIVEVDPGEAAVEFWLNGTKLAAKLWKPYRCDLAPAWKTENEFEIRLMGTVGNLFAKGFGARKPTTRAFGLMAPIEIR